MAGTPANPKDETTTTTVADETTTTTVADETTTTTVSQDTPTSDTSEHKGVAKDGTEPQPTGGETVIDQNADATVLGGNGDVHRTDAESADANVEAGKQAALENHAADHAEDHLDGRSKPYSV